MTLPAKNSEIFFSFNQPSVAIPTYEVEHACRKDVNPPGKFHYENTKAHREFWRRIASSRTRKRAHVDAGREAHVKIHRVSEAISSTSQWLDISAGVSKTEYKK